ncbi:MAG: FliG C-terminal domain-containing protein [Planctomycetota bacterium]|jgi:flagellar motor switch protein FliG
MGLRGIQKVALLLTTLDQATASELLKGQPQEVIQQIAMELSQWDAKREKDPDKPGMIAREFCENLMGTASGGLHVKTFVGSLLQGAAGKDKAAEMHSKMQQAVFERDPFILIADAQPTQLASVLENEPPQAIALVLSSVPPKLSTEVLSRLPEEKAHLTIWRMTQPNDVAGKTIRRIGDMVAKRLMAMNAEEGSPIADQAPKETLRRVAQVLSGLDKDKRDNFLGTIENKDDGAANMVRALMVTWEDITKIEDKSLQQILRNVEATDLAKALHGADALVAEKINSNISERMAQMVEEEASLMGDLRKKDILTAREEVVKPLREANEAEELNFIEDEDFD